MPPTPIKPGNFTVVANDFSEFANSMAERIEDELDTLLALDNLPTLPTDPNDREVRDRRRLFVAIARGVVRHLVDHRTEIDIEVPDGLGGGHTITVNPTFEVDWG